MMRPGRILDLIEAIELSATRNKYKLSFPQLHLINHLKQRSLKIFISTTRVGTFSAIYLIALKAGITTT